MEILDIFSKVCCFRAWNSCSSHEKNQGQSREENVQVEPEPEKLVPLANITNSKSELEKLKTDYQILKILESVGVKPLICTSCEVKLRNKLGLAGTGTTTIGKKIRGKKRYHSATVTPAVSSFVTPPVNTSDQPHFDIDSDENEHEEAEEDEEAVDTGNATATNRFYDWLMGGNKSVTRTEIGVTDETVKSLSTQISRLEADLKTLKEKTEEEIENLKRMNTRTYKICKRRKFEFKRSRKAKALQDLRDAEETVTPKLTPPPVTNRRIKKPIAFEVPLHSGRNVVNSARPQYSSPPRSPASPRNPKLPVKSNTSNYFPNKS